MALTRIGNSAVPAGAVTQHVTDTDLQPIKSDISALALREATNESSAAFNLPNQFIDTFATDTLATKTDCSVTDGYVATAVEGTPTAIDYFNPTQSGGGTTNYQGKASNMHSNNGTWYDIENSGNMRFFDYTLAIAGQENYRWYSPGNSGVNTWVTVDYKENKKFKGNFYIGKINTWGDINEFRISYSTDDNTYTGWDTTNMTSAAVAYGTGSGQSSGGGLNSSGKNTDGDFHLDTMNTSNIHQVVHKMANMPLITARYIRVSILSLHGGTSNTNAGLGVIHPFEQNLTNNATGTAIQNTNTVGSAKTKVGGTMLYKDNAGTNTLGTDLKIYFTCNGGSNWTEASSYTAITPVYSTGIKQVRLGETTCTSGTDIRYKAVWANQASGSKEAQLHGIGVNY